MKQLLFILAAITLSACASKPDRFMGFYQSVDGTLPDSQAYLLERGVKPRLITTEYFDDDLKIFTDQNFAVVGKSEFAAPLQEYDDAIKLGQDLKVTHILLEQKYAYSGTKKAYKFKSFYRYYPSGYGVNYYGIPTMTYDRMPDVMSIPYNKEIPIFKQRAVYLVKRK
ncbi:hypothetical protein [Pseudemcibacter aquimaris]|uniref:hypothetical protein n=1 Tax=Pseudemcibacter aquimaris TaxID=2857064 RepID=UPI002013A047|nr:hypothetical protein [Pseudemcibacter aquimaris]MCC3859882.1 hypothetical protein [Pseudemcibacter aquimaris]WDU57214.1 hypothetical protein KW060_08385 [Pseudemcibacter aquimaris]